MAIEGSAHPPEKNGKQIIIIIIMLFIQFMLDDDNCVLVCDIAEKHNGTRHH